jgi:DNA invertase Pin-like site-specific DNA recombinase
MATSGRPLDPPTRQQVVRLLAARFSRRRIARLCEVSKRTVDKIAREECAVATGESRVAPASAGPQSLSVD